MSLVLQPLLPFPDGCQGMSPHQQGRGTKMTEHCYGGIDVSKELKQKIWSIRHERPGLSITSIVEDRRQVRSSCKRDDARGIGGDKSVYAYIERISHGLDRVKAGNNILRPPNIERRDIEADRTGAGLYGVPLQYAIGIIEVCYNRQAMEIGDSLAKKFYSFAGEIGDLQRQSGDVAAWMRKIGYETAADRIVGHRKDNGNDGRRPLQRRNARSIRNNNIDFSVARTRPPKQRRVRRGPPTSDIQWRCCGLQSSPTHQGVA